MYTTTQRYKDQIIKLSREFTISILITPKTGSPITLTDADLKIGSVIMDEMVMTGDSIELGATPSASFEFEMILNQTNKSLNYAGARVEPVVTLILPATQTYPVESSESVPLGVFHIDEIDRGRKTIKFKALDNMSKLDVDYSKSTLIYPATLANIYANICSYCGVPVKPGLWFYNYTVPRKPKAGLTFRNVLGSLAQMQGSFARCDRLGRISIEWLERYTIATTVTPNTRSKLELDDGVNPVTGVTFETMSAVYNGTGSQPGNILDLSDNVLIQSNHQAILNNFIGYTVYGSYLTPHKTVYSGDPAIMAGDKITVTTVDNTTFNTNVTKLRYKYRGSSELNCEAKLTGKTNLIPAGSKNRGDTGDSTAALAAAMGMYVTADGSGYYVHDQPNLADSTQVFDGNTVPTPPPDYGPPWQLAVDGDFDGAYNGSFKYIGTKTNVIMPSTIKGQRITSYDDMFLEGYKSGYYGGSIILGVISNNPNITRMYKMFEGNAQVTYTSGKTLDISIMDTAKIVDMSYAFYFCGFSYVHLGGWDTSKVYTFANMFDDASFLEIDLSGWTNTDSAITMKNMFLSCSVTNLNISSLTTQNVTNMSGMFSGCDATDIDVSRFITTNVTDMSSMFSYTNTSILDLSSFDTTNVISTTNMFQACTATVGIARTQADADRFNASSNKPAGLTFRPI